MVERSEDFVLRSVLPDAWLCDSHFVLPACPPTA